MKKEYKLIALDLDGTLLNSQSRVPDANRDALEAAHAAGAAIVPCTGRIYAIMPDDVRAMPCVRYVIEANGAQIYDIAEERHIHKALLDIPAAMEIYNWLDSFDCMYDCYLDGKAFAARHFYDQADIYCAACYGGEFYRRTRRPVDSFKDFILDTGIALQKISVFVKTPEEKPPLMEKIRQTFPNVAVSTSMPNNIEINAAGATKGSAIKVLCRYLGIDIAETMAFGDAINDIDMLTTVGTGVAMGNALPEALAAADYVTLSNDECGVAAAIYQLML